MAPLHDEVQRRRRHAGPQEPSEARGDETVQEAGRRERLTDPSRDETGERPEGQQLVVGARASEVRRPLRIGLVLALVAGCTDPPTPGPEPRPPASPVAATAAVQATPDATPCPSDMGLVEGQFCPEADERCEAHHPE